MLVSYLLFPSFVLLTGIVKTTDVATLDARLLALSADLGALKAAKDGAKYRTFNVDEFVLRLRHRLQAAVSDDDQTWYLLGKRAQKYIATVPTVQFL